MISYNTDLRCFEAPAQRSQTDVLACSTPRSLLHYRIIANAVKLRTASQHHHSVSALTAYYSLLTALAGAAAAPARLCNSTS